MKELFIVITVVVIALGFQLVNAFTTPAWIALAVFGHFVTGALTYRILAYFDKGPEPVNENFALGFFAFFGYLIGAVSIIMAVVYAIIQTIKAFGRFLKAIGGVK